MADIWYLSPANAEQEAMLDGIIPHLDRCGVSFHRADHWLGEGEKLARARKMGAKWYFTLGSALSGAGQIEAMARAIVEMDGKEWVTEQGEKRPAADFFVKK